MNKPSSTSSSETAPASGWGGALFALAVMLVVEVGAARQEWIWTALPRSEGGVVDALERQLIEPTEAPRIVLCGSSRVRDAIAPPDLERRLGLAEGSVVNLGLTSGSPRDALILYRRHRARLAKAELLVLGVEDWHFNAGLPPGERDHRFLSLAERLNGFEGPFRRQLLASWLWRTLGARHQLGRLLDVDARAQPPLLLGPDRRLDWRLEVAERGPAVIDPRRQIKSVYRDHTLRRQTLDEIELLAALVREDGGRLIVVEVPLRDAYVEQVERDHPEAWAAYLAALDDVQGAPVVRWGKASSVGLRPEAFLDYGHLTRAGAATFASLLATELAPRLSSTR